MKIQFIPSQYNTLKLPAHSDSFRTFYRFSPSNDHDEEDAENCSFDEAVELFNKREYYRVEEPSRTLIHGILQCAVGFHHLFNQVPGYSTLRRNLLLLSPRVGVWLPRKFWIEKKGAVEFEINSTDDGCCSTQLIDGDGVFNVTGIDSFIKEVKLAECGLSYAVVSIMGPQSSGKSTLLNNLFNTNFREMDAFRGRSQITKGISLAKCAGIEPCTLVMDLEGTDGRERGKDDTAFEKQSALFALAVSDI
ncbi:hypothetical protein F8388_024967 [Cannabis sativa]|uniref:GB1/RHD3-type G domain-containing protein n=1 Tax=Cannabis sativa TaxID=3483 RepID=A0A7J6G3A9_CANSA|nr:hypothetical protein F8388_024967 [Cannabis sativa]